MEQLRQYEREGNNYQTHVRKVSKLFRENPVFAVQYENRVKGGSYAMVNAGFEIAEKAKAFAKENGVDYGVAVREIMARNPGLAEEWHYSRKPAESTRRYQDEGKLDDIPVGGALQQLGALILPFAPKGDLVGAVAVANRYKRLAQNAATEWYLRRRIEKAESLGMPGPRSAVEPMAGSMVLRDNPSIRVMMASGATSAEALRTLFTDRFK